MAQFSDELLDSFVAPELSKLTRVGAPALDTQPDYLRVAFMNHVFGLRYKRKALLHVSITFLKRTMTATDEYRAGRESLTRYIDCLSRQAHDLKATFPRCPTSSNVLVLSTSVSSFSIRSTLGSCRLIRVLSVKVTAVISSGSTN